MANVLASQVAKSTPYDNTVSGLLSTEVNGAIDEIYDLAQNSSRAFVLSSYGANAGTGRYLEMFPSIAMNDAPLEVVNDFHTIAIFARTTAVNATCTIGFYNITPVTPVLLYTLTFTANKKVSVVGSPASPIFTLPAAGRLAIKIDSGSISKPHLYFSGQGG